MHFLNESHICLYNIYEIYIIYDRSRLQKCLYSVAKTICCPILQIFLDKMTQWMKGVKEPDGQEKWQLFCEFFCVGFSLVFCCCCLAGFVGVFCLGFFWGELGWRRCFLLAWRALEVNRQVLRGKLGNCALSLGKYQHA